MTATTAGQLRTRLRALAVVALMAGWAVAAHIGSSGIGNADFNAAIGLIPILLAAAAALWQLPSRGAGAAGFLTCCALLAWQWSQLRNNIALLYYLQHLGAHLALGAMFGRSLLGPGEALLTCIARSLHGDAVSAREARYTRQATVAWTIFFFANAAVSTVLFACAPTELWSLHANLLTAPLVGLMFLAETLCRMRVLPPEERPRLVDIVAAYRRHTQRQDAPPARS